MNYCESLREILNFKRPESLCQFEWGYWPETITIWEKEGLEKNTDPWDAVGITCYERVPVNVRMCPSFEEKVLEEDGDKNIIQNSDGIISEVLKGQTTMPNFLKYPISGMKDFERLKEEKLDPDHPDRFPDNWDKIVEKIKTRNSILVMGGVEISFFGWHRDLMGVERLLMAYYDQPELIHAISRHHVYFLKKLYSRLMKEVDFDFIFMWEDMSYKNGPLISPSMVKEFMLPYYREIIDFFKSMRDCKILLDSDGDVTEIIPLFMGVGVDGLLPFECAAGMDICKIRKEFPKLIIAGGIDKREISKGRKYIDRELGSKLPFMFKSGGYLPALDHHVPPEVSFADFKYYLERVRDIYQKCR